ncbi:MAG: eukaryotic-like serine/threonine-protein kinase [Gaiellaceae bacterium]|nr:eukaryotic-like serine/threonine-protein kinase [Gaiellaceae bacterium]
MIGDVIADRYELLEICGTGGMSTVYKAHDQLLERNVALKVLHPHYGDDEEYVERFRREARAVAQLSHPNIVTVIDRGEADGHQFIVFEFIDGENLKELVGRTGPLPVRRAVELAVSIAEGLAFAHEHGLVHRDVKPQNVLLNGDGEPKVTDFGIARSLDVEHGVTQTGTVMGTSNYLSPEQASGKQVTPATDVYSLGVVLYELLTAEVPFPGDNFVAVAMKHLNEPPPDILERRPDVPLRLASALDRALEKEPERRFASMGEFAAELRQSMQDLGAFDAQQTFIAPSPVLRESAPHRARSRRPRWPVYLLLALIGAAAIVAGALTLGGSKGKHASTGGSAAGAAVRLAAVTGYDPQGTGGEHDADASKATDGNPSTFWYTEHYSSPDFGGLKHGVGLVLDAGRATKVARVTIASDTPGFTAEIETGTSPSGPFTTVSSSQTVGARTTFTLSGAADRYYLVWITSLGSHSSVDVNEVTARG